MPSQDSDIHHVSDTALMVAECRALETESEDGFVRDPFAARLAGERGMAILRAMPHHQMLRFGLGVRSRFIDGMLTELLSTTPIRTVVSLGSGLDTRPWRLDLPPELRWVEVDFAEMLDYKDRFLATEAPRCRRERLSVDLNQPDQRAAVYGSAGMEPASLITEGLLMYLPGSTVESIAVEFREQTGVTQWIADVTTAAFTQAIGGKDAMGSLRHVQASDCLIGEQILETIRRNGWVSAARRSYITDMGFAANRIEKMMGGGPRPDPPPFAHLDPSGVHRFERG